MVKRMMRGGSGASGRSTPGGKAATRAAGAAAASTGGPTSATASSGGAASEKARVSRGFTSRGSGNKLKVNKGCGVGVVGGSGVRTKENIVAAACPC